MNNYAKHFLLFQNEHQQFEIMFQFRVFGHQPYKGSNIKWFKLLQQCLNTQSGYRIDYKGYIMNYENPF